MRLPLLPYREKLNFFLDQNNFQLSSEQVEQTCQYLLLLNEWNQKINLTRHSVPDEVIEKDVLDALYFNMYRIMYALDFDSCLDMGCGAGFLGMMFKILSPRLKIGFLDSDRRKVNFIKQVNRELGFKDNITIQADVIRYPLEYKEYFNAAVTRATWILDDILKYAHYYVRNSGHIFWFASKFQNEKLLKQYFQGLAPQPYFYYEIKPKNYSRKIFIWNKI